jgi:hypothetical protein
MKTMAADMNAETPAGVAFTMKKREAKTQQETGKPKSYRQAMEEFAKEHRDFSRREGNISAVLPQGSPGGLNEEPQAENSELDEE